MPSFKIHLLTALIGAHMISPKSALCQTETYDVPYTYSLDSTWLNSSTAPTWNNTATVTATFPKFNATGRTLTSVSIREGGSIHDWIDVNRSVNTIVGINCNFDPLTVTLKDNAGTVRWSVNLGLIHNHTFTFTSAGTQSWDFGSYGFDSGEVVLPSSVNSSYSGSGTVTSTLITARTGSVFPSNGFCNYRWTGSDSGHLLLKYNYINDRVVHGTVDLGSYAGSLSPWQTVTIAIKFYSVSNVLLGTRTASVTPVNGIGTYSVNIPGTWDANEVVKADGPTWLVDAVAVPMSANTTVNFIFRNGDILKNGVIDLGDFDRLATAFGTSNGGGGFDPAADLDKNGAVDLGDFDILSSSFGESDE